MKRGGGGGSAPSAAAVRAPPQWMLRLLLTCLLRCGVDAQDTNIILSGHTAGCGNQVNGRWDFQGKPSDGRSFWSRDTGGFNGLLYLYFDRNCYGAGYADYPVWMMSSTRPSTTAVEDLDGGPGGVSAAALHMKTAMTGNIPKEIV